MSERGKLALPVSRSARSDVSQLVGLSAAAVMVTVVVPGERIEVEFFADGTVEIERYISTGEDDLAEIVEAYKLALYRPLTGGEVVTVRATQMIKRRPRPPLPREVVCADEAAAKALARRRQLEEPDSSVLWVEKRRNDGRWVAHAFWSDGAQQSFRSALLRALLDPFSWFSGLGT